MRQEKDERHHAIKSQQYKEALAKLEVHTHATTIRHAKLEVELKDVKRERDLANLNLVKVKSSCRELQSDNLALRAVLNGS